MSFEPVNSRVASPAPAAPPPGFPSGPDWTRGVDPSPDERREMNMVRASAFGRAKGKLLEAIEAKDDAAIDALVLKLVDFALAGADARTILTGLV